MVLLATNYMSSHVRLSVRHLPPTINTAHETVHIHNSAMWHIIHQYSLQTCTYQFICTETYTHIYNKQRHTTAWYAVGALSASVCLKTDQCSCKDATLHSGWSKTAASPSIIHYLLQTTSAFLYWTAQSLCLHSKTTSQTNPSVFTTTL